MIDVNEIPKSGILIIDVFFEGYKESFQNDSRRKLLNQVPKLGYKIGIKLEPLIFCLIRSIIQGVGRSIGAEYHYSYTNMDPEKYKKFNSEIQNMCDNFKIWNNYKILICDYAGDFSE